MIFPILGTVMLHAAKDPLGSVTHLFAGSVWWALLCCSSWYLVMSCWKQKPEMQRHSQQAWMAKLVLSAYRKWKFSFVKRWQKMELPKMTDFFRQKETKSSEIILVKMWVGSWQPKTVLWLVRHLGKRNSSGTWMSFLHHIALMRDSLLAQGTFNYMPWMKVVVSPVWAQGMHWDWEVWAKLLTLLKQRQCLNLFYTPNPEKHLSNQALFFCQKFW